MGLVITSVIVIFLFIYVGFVLAIKGLSSQSFAYARACFIAAGLDIIGLSAYWLFAPGVTTQRIVGVLAIGGIISPFVAGAYAWVDYREARTNGSPDPSREE